MKMLLDSSTTRLVISSEFARKQGFKLKKTKNPIYIRNMDRTFNKKGPIENAVEVNIYYQGHRKRTEIYVIGGQKWNMILGMLWLACYNSEINWKIGEVKITRCSKKEGSSRDQSKRNQDGKSKRKKKKKRKQERNKKKRNRKKRRRKKNLKKKERKK